MSLRFGLDVGRRSVKLLRCETSRRPGEAPRAIKATSRDVNPALDGEARRAALVAAIRECAAEFGATGREVSVAVPRSEAVVKTVNLPPVSVEERGKLIAFQAAKDVPFELSDVVLASGVVGETSGATSNEVIYAAVRKTVIESLSGLVIAAGLKPGVLEVSTQAAARAVRLLAPDVVDAVLVEIGALATDISVLRKGKLAYSRSASVGFARSPSETGQRDVTQWFDQLVAEVQRSMRAADSGENRPTLLLCAGGGAQVEHIVPTLAARLGLPAQVLDPTGERGSPALLVARGLADPRTVPGIPVLDLAGRADAENLLTKRRKAAFLGGLVAVLVATTGLLIRREIVAREEQADRLEEKLKELTPKVNELKKLEKQILTAQGWKNRKGRSLDVLLAIANALPREDAYLRRFTWSEGHTVVLAGRARDVEAIQRFLRRLNHDPIVELATPDFFQRNERDTELKGLDFQITLKLKEIGGKGEEKHS